MSKGRMEAFSDGVFAVIITIMVLEMKSPHGTSLEALMPLIPVFFSYVLSFIYVGIYWTNHHHLLQAVQHVAGGVLWANLHLLFWLSLTPFATAWMGENPLAPWPVALYGAVLLFASIAYFILTKRLIAHQGAGSVLAKSIGGDRKGKSVYGRLHRRHPAGVFAATAGMSLLCAGGRSCGSFQTGALRKRLETTRVSDEQALLVLGFYRLTTIWE